MENALRACCKGIKIGKILIHGEGNNGRQVCLGNHITLLHMSLSHTVSLPNISLVYILPQLIYKKLPSDISSRHVLLLDPVLASGLVRKKISTWYFMLAETIHY